MAVGDWTFTLVGVTATFVWLEDGTPPLTPSFKQRPVYTARKLIGSRQSEVNQIGFEIYQIQGRIRIEDGTNATNLLSMNGYSGTLSNGATTWNAFLDLDLDPIISGAGGYEGGAIFICGDGP